jgi:hypothetical protein
LPENENEAGSVQPNVQGSGGSGAKSGQGGQDGQPGSREPGKPIAAAYYSVVTMVGALSGVGTFVGPFAKGGTGLIVLTISFVVVLIALDVVVKWVAEKLQQQVTTSMKALASIVVLAVALGVGGGYVYWYQTTKTQAVPPPTSSAATPMTTLSTAVPSNSPSGPSSGTACPKPLTITSPANDTKIVGHVGVSIGIKACGLTAGETGWLFDFDESSKTYGLDGDGGPIVTGNRSFTFDDTPVGQSSDQNEYVEITLVLADSACNTALNGMDLNNNQPSTLPAGCQVVGQVEVIETW